MKLFTNIHHVRGNWLKSSPGQKSKVTVIARSVSIFRLRDLRPAVCCLSVNIYFTLRDISVLGEISTKLGTNVHHVSGHCSRGFQYHGVKGQGHKVTAMKILCTAEGN